MNTLLALWRILALAAFVATGVGVLNSPACAAAPVKIIAFAKAGNSQAMLRTVVDRSLALQPGDSLLVYDAVDQSEIADITVPDRASSSRLDKKAAAIAPAIGRVREWLAQVHAPATDDPNFIHASAFLDAIASVIAEHGGKARIMFVGGPWFSAPGAFSAKTYIGAFPSDGMILGSRSESPFGTEGRHDLSGVTVDYCVTGGAGVFSNPAQRERFHRAWSLLVHQRGGNLVTFTTDIAACTASLARPIAIEGEHFDFDAADARVVRMERVEEATPHVETWHPTEGSVRPVPHPTGWTTPAPATEQRAVFDQPVRTTPPANLKGPAWIGIQWSETVDLDLYARCAATSPFLYYGHQASQEGRHDFDFKGGTGQDFEVVELLTPCPDISKAEVWVNFFGGAVPRPIKAVVALKFEGGLYRSEVTMPALSGNGGHGFAETAGMSGPAWVRIDVPSLLRLSSHASRAN